MHSKTNTTLETSSYEILKRQVKESLSAGLTRAERLVEIEKARTYWETGQLINAHIKKEKPEAEHAAYGQQVLKKLTSDLGTNETFLYNALRFARAYPIFSTSKKLGWSHYRALLSLEDTTKRAALTAQAIKESWSSRELQAKVDDLNDTASKALSREKKPKAPARFIPKRGQLHTYRMDSEDKIDLGFSTFFTPDLRALIGFKEGDILQLKEGKLAKLKDATAADIYTYRAKVERVVDGDTLWVWIDLGFKTSVRQKLRLRGLDAPELPTKEGEKAKRFVENEIKKFPSIIVTTTKPDKFDRYLSDIYLGEAEGAPCLNKILLDKGLAQPIKVIPENHWDESNTGRF